MKWTGYTPGFDRAARMLGVPLNVGIERMTEVVCKGVGKGSLLGTEAMGLVIERGWHSLGRPSYRVTRDLGEALLRTRLDIEAKYLRFPQPAFGLEIPPKLDIRNKRGGRLLGLLIGGVRERDAEDGGTTLSLEAPDGVDAWRFMVLQDWEDEETPCNLLLTFAPETIIAERLDRVLSDPLPPISVIGAKGYEEAALKNGIETFAKQQATVAGHDASISSDVTLTQIVSLVIGSAMFAVSANARWAKPVVPSKKNKKRSRRKQRNRAPEPKRWLLGADIVLPGSRAVGKLSDGECETRSLTWAHLRQGHLRWTLCGPKDDRHYELKYVKPTIVRPDLPMAPHATRHLMPQPE